MAKRKITNDMEFWQLKEDYARTLLAARTEEDKKKKPRRIYAAPSFSVS